MQHYRQETNQCLLTSIAMVSGKPIAYVRELWRACNHKRESFHETDARRQDPAKRNTASGAEFWYGTYNNLTAVLGLKFEYPWSENWAYRPTTMPRYPTPSELQGKGILSVAWAIGAHAIAYEDGIVHDPNLDVGMPLEQWIEDCGWMYGERVYGVQINRLLG